MASVVQATSPKTSPLDPDDRQAAASLTTFGVPIEKNGTTVVPVSVRGRATGVYVINEKSAQWIPAFDVNRMIPVMLLGEVIALSLIRLVGYIIGRRRR